MRLLIVILAMAFCANLAVAAQTRRAGSEEDLRFWLANMVTHQYSPEEMSAVLGLTTNEVASALTRLKVQPRRADGSLLVLPYPGGRHPRIGFLDGAVEPQRETKFSVFTPWDSKSYVVVDLPEAIFSNLGLIYLAHTHVPTVWSLKGITLPVLEWKRNPDGSLESERVLPNQIAFGANVRPATNGVRMELWLRNGTEQTLTGLRVQNCVMLKGVEHFNQQTNVNKVLSSPYVACRSPETNRWIITAWEHSRRPWANPPVPCLHSDPQFPDCAAGQTQRLRGWLSFYEGRAVEEEFKRLEALNWRRDDR